MKKEIEGSTRFSTPYIGIDPRKCTACWKCIDSCKEKVIGKVSILWHKHIVIENSNACCGCNKCITTCTQNVFCKL